MTFPTTQGRFTGVSSTTNAATWAIPSGALPTAGNSNAGDLIVIFLSVDGTTTASVSLSGVTNLTNARILASVSDGAQVTGHIIVGEITTGGQAAALTFNNNGDSQQYSCVTYQIRSSTGKCAIATHSGAFFTSATGSSTNSDPAAFDPEGSARDFTFYVSRHGDSTTTASGAPTNYTNLQTIAGGGTQGASTNGAERQLNTNSSENPGTFTSSTEQWVCFTIAIAQAASNSQSADATTTPVATRINQLVRSLLASTSPLATLVNQIGKIASATTTPIANLVRSIGKPLSGSTTPVATRFNSTSKILTGTTTPPGTIVKFKTTVQAAGATTSPLASLAQTITHALGLSATTSPAASLVRRIGKPLSASTNPLASLVRAITRRLSGTTSPAGSLTRNKTTAKTLSVHTANATGNYLAESEDLNASPWNINSGDVIGTGYSDPDGGTTAFGLIGHGGNAAEHGSVNFCDDETAEMTFSIWAKAGDKNFIYLFRSHGSAVFDLSNGTVATQTSGEARAGIIDAGGGWYRCWVGGINDDTALAAYPGFNARESAGGVTFAGDDTTVNIYVWHPQLNDGSGPTAYVATTTTKLISTHFASLLRHIGKTLIATVTPIATADAQFSGSGQTFNQSADATTSPSASIIRQLARLLLGTTSPTATASRSISKTSSAETQPPASIIRSITRSIIATTDPTGSLARSISRLIIAQADGQASLTRQIGKLLNALTSPLASRSLQITHLAAGTTSPEARLIRSTVKSLQGTTSPIATTSEIKVVLAVLNALTSPVASHSAQVAKNFLATGQASASVIRSIAKALSVAADGLASSSRLFHSGTTQQICNATTQPVATMLRSISKTLNAFVDTVATLSRQHPRALAAQTNPAPSLAHQLQKRLEASTSPAAMMIKTLARIINATTTAPAWLVRAFARIALASTDPPAAVEMSKTTVLELNALAISIANMVRQFLGFTISLIRLLVVPALRSRILTVAAQRLREFVVPAAGRELVVPAEQSRELVVPSEGSRELIVPPGN